MCKENLESRLGSPLPRRILVFRALQLGDMLCAIPALRALRAALPESEIVLLGLPWAREFCRRYLMYLNGFREFPGYPGLPEQTPQLERLPALLAEIQKEKFDLAVQMHGKGNLTNPLTVLLGARQTAGFYVPGAYCPERRHYLPYPDHGLEVHRLLRLVEFLGCPSQGDELEFPLTEQDIASWHGFRETMHLSNGSYVCVHPGASVPERRWPPEYFAAVGRALADQGLSVVLTGTEPEAHLTQAVGRAMGAPYLDLAGRTSLGTAAALLKEARLVVCNDTGISHLAAALQVPSVVISSGDHPNRWAPVNQQLHRTFADRWGVNPRDVLQQVHELLAN